MAKFIVTDHRNRKKLTLTAAHSDTIDASITLTLPGTRVLELTQRVCEKYADALDAHVKAGALIPTTE